MSKKKIKYRKATVTLKQLIWDGAKKVDKGTVFEDEKCFEGKYQPDTADVVFHNEEEAKAEAKKAQEKREAEAREKLKAEVRAEIEAEAKAAEEKNPMSDILK